MTTHEIIDVEFTELEPSSELAHHRPEPSPPPFDATIADTLGVLGMQRELLLSQHRALCDMLRQMELPVYGAFASPGTSGLSGSPSGAQAAPPGRPLGVPTHIMENNMRAMDRAIDSIMSSLRHGFGLRGKEGSHA